MTQTTPNHTQTVAGWAALEQNGKITPYVFKRREREKERKREGEKEMTQTTPNHTQTVAGWAALEQNGKITPYVFKRRENGADDVTIKILFCGMCHTDLHHVRNDWGITFFPLVPGHEITGLITKVGSNVTEFKVGDRVGVGLPGGVLSQLYVVHVPDSLPLDAAAPLLCAGITVYSPMKEHNMLQAGKKLGVVGLGGLGHVAIKFAKAFGLHVTVISTSPSKEKEARERLGADAFLLSTDAKQMAAESRTLDFVIDTVAAKHSLGPILNLLKVSGNLVLVGAPDKPVELPSFPLIFGKRTVTGSLIGGMKETQEMMNICGKHNITCDIELVKPNQINEALDRLARNDVRYPFRD
ncbi:hypothetical protein J5N97_022742 [Dioscorea zingiberensis]|uniref:cinnamyl-alcohol dehydrogenase n=1 Tax=Dioscorea zingiberensis TaxID=325984 RepID=A0A9D5CCL2_9LILI|nr:hypothetical protein J5N97_022742 [Dioscorea zingiberensis]